MSRRVRPDCYGRCGNPAGALALTTYHHGNYVPLFCRACAKRISSAIDAWDAGIGERRAAGAAGDISVRSR